MVSFGAIIDSVEALLRERFPKDAYYRERVPVDFQRPAFLIELGQTEMLDANANYLELQVAVKVTTFSPVDEYYNCKVDDLIRRMAAVQELFAVDGLRVEDRVLHLIANSGNSQLDYAEVGITLRYHDDRPQEGKDWPLMRSITTTIKS